MRVREVRVAEGAARVLVHTRIAEAAWLGVDKRASLRLLGALRAVATGGGVGERAVRVCAVGAVAAGRRVGERALRVGALCPEAAGPGRKMKMKMKKKKKKKKEKMKEKRREKKREKR